MVEKKYPFEIRTKNESMLLNAESFEYRKKWGEAIYKGTTTIY